MLAKRILFPEFPTSCCCIFKYASWPYFRSLLKLNAIQFVPLKAKGIIISRVTILLGGTFTKKKTLVSPCNRIRKSEQMFTYGTVAVPQDLGQEIESTVDGPITSLSIHFALRVSKLLLCQYILH